MSFDKEIQKIKHAMESFFLSTHLSICAIDQAHQLLVVPSVSNTFTEFMGIVPSSCQFDLLDQMVAYASLHHKQFQTEDHIVYTPFPGISFSICPILRDNPENGYYLIGPYTSDPCYKTQYLFKPEHCMRTLVKLLYTFYETLPSHNSSAEEKMHCNYHINKAIAYIHAHAHEAISLSEVADHLDINKSYLCTLFKKYTNDCFSTYLNKVRIEKSKTLLRETNASILDIALQVGFSSASYYNTLFKKLTGTTPLAYRQQDRL